MNPLPERFDQKLIAAQRVDDALRRKYEQELSAMFEKRLTATTRTVHFIVGILGVAMALGFTIATLTSAGLPWEARLGFAAGAVFAAIWAIMMFRIIRRGSIDLRFDEKAQAGLGWGFVVIMITLFMLIGGKLPDKITGLSMVLNGLVFLIFAAVFMLQYRINDSRMKLEERLLEMQLKLAEIAEELKKK